MQRVINKSKVKSAKEDLNKLYNSIPSTKGCMENITKPDGCKAHCCFNNSPSLFYIEFINAWQNILETWSNDDIKDLIRLSLRKYLFPKEYNGCIFLDKEKYLCKNHIHRPLSCREYGIIPKEEYNSRYQRLKVLYPHVKDQCDLVSTENGEVITKKDTDNWFAILKSLEIKIGVKFDKLNDGQNGTYRHYHEHILYEIGNENMMQYLTEARLYLDDSVKEGIIQDVLNKLETSNELKLN